MKNRKASLWAIFLTVFIDLLGFGILIPLLPTFGAKQLHLSEFQIGIAVAVYSLMQFLFNPVLGRISDRFGRRPVILVSLLLTVTSYIIFSFTDSFLLLIVSRMLAGLGGSNIGTAQAYIADITTPQERTKGMGFIGAAFGLGFMFGPFMGGMLSKFGYSFAGLGSAAFSFTAFLFTFFFLPESNIEKRNTKLSLKIFDINYAKKILKNPALGIMILLYFIIVFSMANLTGTLSLLGYNIYHFSDAQNGMLFGIMGLIGVIIQAGLMRILSVKFSERGLIIYGAVFMMAGLALLPFGAGFASLCFIVSLYGIGQGILQPVILGMISKQSPAGEQGAVLGINQSVSAFGRILGPIWGGFSFTYIGYQFPFITGAIFTFLFILIGYFFIKKV